MVIKEKITKNAIKKEFLRLGLNGDHYNVVEVIVRSLLKKRYKTEEVEIIDIYHLYGKAKIYVKFDLIKM